MEKNSLCENLFCVYAVKDLATGRFGLPCFFENEKVAKRAFIDVCNRPSTVQCNHPGDYELWYLGLYDNKEGQFINDSLTIVMTGLEAHE